MKQSWAIIATIVENTLLDELESSEEEDASAAGVEYVIRYYVHDYIIVTDMFMSAEPQVNVSLNNNLILHCVPWTSTLETLILLHQLVPYNIKVWGLWCIWETHGYCIQYARKLWTSAISKHPANALTIIFLMDATLWQYVIHYAQLWSIHNNNIMEFEKSDWNLWCTSQHIGSHCCQWKKWCFAEISLTKFTCHLSPLHIITIWKWTIPVYALYKEWSWPEILNFITSLQWNLQCG